MLTQCDYTSDDHLMCQKQVRVQEYSNVTLACSFYMKNIAKLKKVRYDWYKNVNEYDISYNSPVSSDKYMKAGKGQLDSMYTVTISMYMTDVLLQKEGNYTCVVNIEDTKLSAVTELMVNGAY